MGRGKADTPFALLERGRRRTLPSAVDPVLAVLSQQQAANLDHAAGADIKSTPYGICPQCGLWQYEHSRAMDRGHCDGQLDFESWEPAESHDPVAIVRVEVPDYSGRRVQIPKGTLIRASTDPKVNLPRTTQTSYTITVNHMSRVGCHPTVRWPGAGGYWRDVHVEDVCLAD